MSATNSQSHSISIDDFSDKCRICLKNYNDMIDIFASGISNQVMEVVNIKLTYNDRLPKRICQNCNKQFEEFHKFQNLARDSDNYLRTLLFAEEVLNKGVQNYGVRRIKKKKKKIHSRYCQLNNSRKLLENLKDDKIYLILVTEASTNSALQNEICIKDMDMEKENIELTDLCRSLINSKSNNETFPNENYKNNQLYINEIDSIENKDNRIIQKINVLIYECSECEEAFETQDHLKNHCVTTHNIEISPTVNNYECPVCAESESDKSLFMNHLSKHKNEGFLFIKVDKNGKHIPLGKFEQDIFQEPKLSDVLNLKNRVFKINTECYKCFLCKKVKSATSITDHLKECFPDFEENDYLAPHVKYSCPACLDSWNDDLQAFYTHLSSHREDNIFFVKVDHSGQSDYLTEDETMFTPFEKALEILLTDEELSACGMKEKVLKMHTLCNCLICDFNAESISSLSEHYMNIHDEIIPESFTFCPVCDKEYKMLGIDERAKIVDHMINHKSEGFYFLKVDASGVIVNTPDDLGVFSILSDFFNGASDCPELEYMTDISVPEVCIEVSADRHMCNFEQDHLSKKEIVNHVKLDAEDESRTSRDYVCEKCGRKCYGKGNYKRHFLTHSDKGEVTSSTHKRPTCCFCNKTFSNRTALNEHKRHHLNDGTETDQQEDSGRTICEICGRRLSNNASLSKHRKLHSENKETVALKCQICDRGFRRESALKRHVSYHLNPNYFECEICKLPLPSLASLQRHNLWHQGSPNTYDCKVCKVSFLTKERLAAHQTHTGHNQDKKRFECNVCHERFFVGREFSQHIKLHPKYKMSECTLCGKRLSTMQSLMLHLSRHFESNSILCPHCGKQFFEERNYHRHLLTHKGVKPFSCDFEGCKKSFYTYFELNRHKKYHNNTRDFSCSYCPKSFHEANHLKVHIRTHTGERPYTCPHCNKGFVTRTRCKHHINLIHQGVGCDLIQSSISKKVAVFEALETVA